MARPTQDVRIWGIQDRRARHNATMPWVVRWRVDGQQRSRAFRTKAEADNIRSRLVVAARDGERFDRVTGEPESWGTAPDERPVFRWAREWLAEQWSEWQPRTRASAIEAMSRFVPLVHHRTVPTRRRSYGRTSFGRLTPPSPIDSDDRCERWMQRWSPPLNELDRELMAGVERRLVDRPARPIAVRIGGQSLSQGGPRLPRPSRGPEHPQGRPVATAAPWPQQPQVDPAAALGRCPCASGSVRDGIRHRRSTESSACEPHVSGHDRRHLLRRTETLRSRDAPDPGSASPGVGLGPHRCDRGRHRMGRDRRAEDRSAASTNSTEARGNAELVDRVWRLRR